MPGIDQVSIVRKCSVCHTEVETVQVKKDNMMLSSKELIWCPGCETEQPERRGHCGAHGDDPGRTGLLSSVPDGDTLWRSAGALI